MNPSVWKRMGSRLGIEFLTDLVLELPTFPVRHFYSISNTLASWEMFSAQVLRVSSSSLISSQVGNWQVESMQSHLWGWPANQRRLLLPPPVQRDE